MDYTIKQDWLRVRMSSHIMTNPPQYNAPEGYEWVKDLAQSTRKDVDTLVWLCEGGFMEAIKLDGYWAVRLVRTGGGGPSGSAIVHDLKSGRDITIGSIIGTYVEVRGASFTPKDKEKMLAQAPILEKLNQARQW